MAEAIDWAVDAAADARASQSTRVCTIFRAVAGANPITGLLKAMTLVSHDSA